MGGSAAHGGAGLPWGKNSGGVGLGKPTLSILEIQQEEARVAKTQQQQGVD